MNNYEKNQVLEEVIASLPTGQKLFRLTSLARMLGVSRIHLYQCIQNGVLTAVKMGHGKTAPLMVSRPELIKFIRSRFTVAE